MRRLSMKSKKGKTDASDNESTHQDDVEEQGNGDDGDSNAAGSGDESAGSEDTKVNSKRKSKRGKKKGKAGVETDDGDTKKKKKAAESEEPEESEEYEVESIVSMKVNRGKRQFKIRWKGYGPESDTWENEEDLSCPEIIKTFLEENENTEENSKSNKRSGKSSNKTPKKKLKVDDEDETNNVDSETKEYEVDRVMEVHFKKNGTREFLIHWKGFSHKDDTWEPEKNLNCPDLIEKFMARVDKAKTSGARELRANPQHTERFTLNMRQAGRRLSRRNQGKQRATYYGYV